MTDREADGGEPRALPGATGPNEGGSQANGTARTAVNERAGSAGRRRTTTIEDVARLARVSTATVTRALQGHPRVRPETRARVVAAAASLRYVPHLGARALATRTSQTIGLIVPSSADGFWGEVAEGLEERAALEGFSTLLATSHGDPERERALIRLFVGKRVDGIVVGSAAGSSWRTEVGDTVPIVLINWEAPLGDTLQVAAREGPVEAVRAEIERRLAMAPSTHVRTDDFGAAADATRHLLGLGHRAVAFAGLRPVRPSLLRLLGMRSAMEEEGLRPSAVIEASASLDGGHAAGVELIRSRTTSAVIAFDDMVAVGIMRAAHAAGLVVPRDLSVVGFDDVAVAAFVEPPLTTIRQHKAGLGTLAVEVILTTLRGSVAAVPTLLPGTLVVRHSSASPGA